MARKPEDLFKLTDMADEVGENVGDQSAKGLATAKRAINRAINAIFSYDDGWSFSRSSEEEVITEVGENRYTVDSNVKEVKHFYIKDPAQKLLLMDVREFRRSQSDDTVDTGEPSHYFPDGYEGGALQYFFWPTPDSVLTIFADVERYPAFLKRDGSKLTEIMPQKMYDVVIGIATKYLQQKNDDTSYAQTLVEVERMIEIAHGQDSVKGDSSNEMREQTGESNLVPDGRLPNEYGVDRGD